MEKKKNFCLFIHLTNFEIDHLALVLKLNRAGYGRAEVVWTGKLIELIHG